MQFYCQNTIWPKKNLLNYDYRICVEKWSMSAYHLFFYFCTKLAESSFLCPFRVESVNVLFFHGLIWAHFVLSANSFAHAQTLSRMSSLSGRMNIARILNSLLYVRKSDSLVSFIDRQRYICMNCLPRTVRSYGWVNVYCLMPLNIPFNERICKLCKLEIKDEIHFLLQCPILNSFRTQAMHKSVTLYWYG